MPKSIIIYGSETKLTNAHKPVKSSDKQPDYFVRIKLINYDDVSALDHAQPMRGETVLNTIEMQ